VDLVLVTDCAGRLVLAEGSALPAFGVAPHAVGCPISAVAASVPELAHAYRSSLEGRSHSVSTEVGDIRFDIQSHPLRGGDHEISGVVVVAHEQSESERERLVRSEARLANAQRIARIGSWEWDVTSNAVTWSNEMHRIYGLEPGQFGGTYEAFLARVFSEDKSHTESVVFDAYRTAKPFVYDHRIVRPNGEIRMLHTRGEVVTDDKGRPLRLTGSCWDITDRWMAEEQLARSVSLWRASLESTADGILVVDREEKVQAYNQRLLDLWGLSPAAVERCSFEALLQLVHCQIENGEACLKRVIELRAQPDAESFDQLRFHDGRVFERYSRPQRIGDQVVGRVWSYRDVTDREGLLRRAVFLAEASRLLSSLDAEAGLEGVARLALPAMADACAVDLFADSGGPRRLLSISLDKPMAMELPREVFAGHAFLKREGASGCAVVPVIARGLVLGALTFSVCGERRYSEADLEVVKELAARAALAIENARLYRGKNEALAARDEFLSIAAHELRGPVTSIHLAAQTLPSVVSAPPDRTRLLQIIEREDRRLARFVDEMLEISRVKAGGLHFDLTLVDLAEVVRNCAARLAPDITRSRSPLSMAMAGSVQGTWDRARLDQVVANLISNAIKFGLGRPIEVSISSTNGVARLVVRDHGIGIPREKQEQIFEPFERAVSSRQYGGLGLGLYIVRRIVEGLGGNVTVESNPDQGTTFTVELPEEHLQTG
jgi:PAS domain S-box-containing protein